MDDNGAGPVLLLSLYWKKMTKWGALSGMVVGGLTVIVWIVSGLSTYIYEMVPGFILSLIAVIVVSTITEKREESINKEFREMEEILSNFK
ncbi:hypothetical protein LGK95_16855 [Clostridium algoriphilum]|uniref:sodium:solute symporter family transporter n=1 Tax=Clostridium algoriphilum TaxID=198347 RepID=UPI001CF1E2C9|nr:hypothetical protein [Clostridium algoriphilum]MCB2295156.1 hypothetical protein [Clostridium algoriphilum]